MTVLKPFAKPTWVENDSGDMMPSRRAIYLKSSDASIGLTFTDLDNADDPAGVGSTEVDLKAAGGGGGLTLLPYSTTYYISDWSNVDMNGTRQPLAATNTDAPFMDAAGHVTEAGLYAIGADVSGPTGVTTKGLVYQVVGPRNYYRIWPVDALDTPELFITQDFEICPITAADLPLNLNNQIGIIAQTDATGDFEARLYIAQIAA